MKDCAGHSFGSVPLIIGRFTSSPGILFADLKELGIRRLVPWRHGERRGPPDHGSIEWSTKMWGCGRGRFPPLRPFVMEKNPGLVWTRPWFLNNEINTGK